MKLGRVKNIYDLFLMSYWYQFKSSLQVNGINFDDKNMVINCS